MLPATPPAAPAAPVAPATPPARTRRNNWLWIILGIVALLALCLLCSTVIGLSYWMTRPAAVPTAAPYAPPATEAPTAPAPAAPTAGCPTTAEVKTATGVDIQRIGTEACAFVWRGTPPATISAICPLGWVCTFDVVNDIVVVHTGVGQSAQIRAATWRWMGSYPGEDSCSLFHKEAAFAVSENPTFKVRFQATQDGSGTPIGPQTCP